MSSRKHDYQCIMRSCDMENCAYLNLASVSRRNQQIIHHRSASSSVKKMFSNARARFSGAYSSFLKSIRKQIACRRVPLRRRIAKVQQEVDACCSKIRDRFWCTICLCELVLCVFFNGERTWQVLDKQQGLRNMSDHHTKLSLTKHEI